MAAEAAEEEEDAGKEEQEQVDHRDGEKDGQEEQREQEEGVLTMDLEAGDLFDPNPDIRALFCHYNQLYFQDKLEACTVDWSTGKMTLCAGICKFNPGGGCAIRLSEPLLKFRTSTELKETLLHEMIHAYLWLTNKNQDHDDHGPSFQAVMHDINNSAVLDHQRPAVGYHIDIFHNFKLEVNNYRRHHWKCTSCGDYIKRAMNRDPSPSDCFLKGTERVSCQSENCHWHIHEMSCGGKYEKVVEPAGYIDRRRKPGKPTTKSSGTPANKSSGKMKNLVPNFKENISTHLDKQVDSNTSISKKASLEKFFRKGFGKLEEAPPALKTEICKDEGSDSLSDELGGRERKKRRNTDVSESIEGGRAPSGELKATTQDSDNTEVDSRSVLLMNECTVIIGWKGWCGFEGTENEVGVKALENKRSRRRMLSRNRQVGAPCKVEVDLEYRNAQLIEGLDGQEKTVTGINRVGQDSQGRDMDGAEDPSTDELMGDFPADSIISSEKGTLGVSIVHVPREGTTLEQCADLGREPQQLNADLTCPDTRQLNAVLTCLETSSRLPHHQQKTDEDTLVLLDDDEDDSGAIKSSWKFEDSGRASSAHDVDHEMDDHDARFAENLPGDSLAKAAGKGEIERVEDDFKYVGRAKRPRGRKSQTCSPDAAAAPVSAGPSASCPICGYCLYGDIQNANFNTRFNQHIDSCMKGTS